MPLARLDLNVGPQILNEPVNCSMHPLPLRTPSLVLRHFVPEDAPVAMNLNNEETTRRWLPSHVYPDLSQAVASLAYLIKCYSSPGDATLGPYCVFRSNQPYAMPSNTPVKMLQRRR